VPKVQKIGAGAKLFQDLDQSRRVIEACLQNTKLPISVKTRTQAGKVSVLDFVEKMKDLPIAALMVHGRTLAQGFSGEVDYKILNRAKKKFKGVFIANGGIDDLKSAQEMLKKTNADGIGIGQAACGQPFIFEEIKKYFLKDNSNTPRPREARVHPSREGIVFTTAWEHAKLMEKLKGKQGMLEMRKHLCWYVKGLPGAAELRQEFVKVETLNDIKKLLKYFFTF